MAKRGSKVVLDLMLAGLLIYIGVWVYEFANLASLTLLGFQPTLSFSGLFPAGVSAISTVQRDLALAKLLQITISVSLVLPLFFLLRRCNLPATKITIVGTVSTYCATFLWEALSISWISATLAGQASFAGLNVVAMFLLVSACQKSV